MIERLVKNRISYSLGTRFFYIWMIRVNEFVCLHQSLEGTNYDNRTTYQGPKFS